MSYPSRYNPRRNDDIEHYIVDIEPIGKQLYEAVMLYCERTGQKGKEAGIYKELIHEVFAAINTSPSGVFYALNEYPVWKAIDTVDAEDVGQDLYRFRAQLADRFREAAIKIWDRIDNYNMPRISYCSNYMVESCMLGTLVLSHHEIPDEG